LTFGSGGIPQRMGDYEERVDHDSGDGPGPDRADNAG
jgi:hypothetical protein